jgi:hypothetical protein
MSESQSRPEGAQVFKLQRPLFTSDGEMAAPKALMYNRKRDQQIQLTMTPNIIQFFKDSGKPKVYVLARLLPSANDDGPNKVEFFKIVPDEDW